MPCHLLPQLLHAPGMIRYEWKAVSAARTPRQFNDELESTKRKATSIS